MKQKLHTKEVNLLSLIQEDQSTSLNINGNNDISGILQGNGNEFIQSNTNVPEILIYLKFTGLVNITKILIDSKPQNLDNTPDILKIFANSSNLDFADAAANSATETIKLEGKFGNKIGLNIPKFRKISELVLYFTREDAEFIQLNSIQLYGTPGDELFNISKMKNEKEKKYK